MTKSMGSLPSVDEVLRGEVGRLAVARFGRTATLEAVRGALEGVRGRLRQEGGGVLPERANVARQVADVAIAALEAGDRPRLKPVINLTGTVLHTNLGRAILPEAAIAAAIDAMRHPAALEFDLEQGGRGKRDDIIRELICELTGAEDTIIVNNNAAAVSLVLNTVALGRQTIVSRGELIEIGGSFRMPDIMARAGTRLREVGTTNRTHLHDYEAAIGITTALLMKVHSSNYLIQGFTKEITTAELVGLAHARNLPVLNDLGSGTLIDLARYGLRHEPTVQETLAAGADLVTFSGDKLLGGPQAGFIVGRKDLVQACDKNPIKRTLRIDKIRLAALEATLRLYRDPDRLAETLPTLHHLTRRVAELDGVAQRLRGPLAAALGPGWTIEAVDCASQVGSGALPLETLSSRGLALKPSDGSTSGRLVEALAAEFRRLAVPVIGRIEKQALVFDLRCLDDEAVFVAQLGQLTIPQAAA